MKKFNYNQTGILSFTHQGNDFLINGIGPHDLPEDNQLVKSLEAQEILTEFQEPVLINQTKSLITKKL